jgi:hypothetical protein
LPAREINNGHVDELTVYIPQVEDIVPPN